MNHASAHKGIANSNCKKTAVEHRKSCNSKAAIYAIQKARSTALETKKPDALSEAERQDLLHMGTDLERAWHHANATSVTRERIIRTVVREIVVRVENDRIEMVVHRQGGDHTPLSVKKNKLGHHRWGAAPEIEPLIRGLARQLSDKAIAALLNRLGKTTGRQSGWTQSRVCIFRSHLPSTDTARARRAASTLCRKRPRS
ncbi:hypothetical protein [Mesorhizobium sp. M0130]|uniref:hypothetical protein n=1 Tax=Mesorhizobium sp. M0130 TaxID=2956887 RepID=UPI0033390860